MSGIGTSALQQSLEAEFCPPLDSALVAALVADHCPPSIVPTDADAALYALRQQLTQLASSASPNHTVAGEHPGNVPTAETEQETDASVDMDSLFDAHLYRGSSSGGVSTASSAYPLTLMKAEVTARDSAIEFLHAAFPHRTLAELRVRLALEEKDRKRAITGNSDDDETTIDMAQIIEELLTEDYIQELEERGLDGANGAEDAELDFVQDLDAWTKATPKLDAHGVRKPGPDNYLSSSPASPDFVSPSRKKKKTRGRKIIINSIRQQHQTRSRPIGTAVDDMWSQISSVSSFLETLIPGRPATFFRSYFHSPTYPNPYDALCAALSDVPRLDTKAKMSVPSLTHSQLSQTQTPGGQSGEKLDYIGLIPRLIEFLLVDGGSSVNIDTGADADVHARLAHHAELAITATRGQLDAALEITKLLLELEADKEFAQEMGIYHERGFIPGWSSALEVPSSPGFQSGPSSPGRESSMTSNGLINRSISSEPPSPSVSSNAWKEVTRRNNAPRPELSPHAAFIPAYDPRNVARRNKAKARADTIISSGIRTANVGTSRDSRGKKTQRAASGEDYRSLITESRARRAEALHTASVYFRGGSGIGGGTSNRLGGKHKRLANGEIAMFYALEAQRHVVETQKLQLDAARQRVENKRLAPGADSDTIDLHYCTSAEALALVDEVLDEGWVGTNRNGSGTSSRAGGRVLRIITGRGTHSANGVPVLAPVLRNWLEREGWNVSSCDGGLVVQGRFR